MQLKKTLFLSLLTVGLFSGLAYFSNSVNASEKTDFDELVNNPNVRRTIFYKHPGATTFSINRQKKYKLINYRKVNKQYFLRNSGNIYSKNLNKKYSVREQHYLYYVDAQETLYNKQNNKYYTYYHVSTIKGNVSGWTWNRNLISYGDITSKNSISAFKLFKNATFDSTLQYLVNLYRIDEIHNSYDSFSYFIYTMSNTNYKQASQKNNTVPVPGIIKAPQKYINALKQNRISYSNYLKIAMSKKGYKLPTDFSDYKVGLYAEPKSSKNYGSINFIFQRKEKSDDH